MALVYAICTECNGEIQVDNTHDSGVCPYCNKVFNIRAAERKYSAVQNTSSKAMSFPAIPAASSSMISARNYAWQNMIPMYQCESAEANQAYLRGISFLAYGDCRSAAGWFLEAAKLSPITAHFWLYLLYAVTDRFTDIEVIAHKDESRLAGDTKRVIAHNIYKNFLGTARPEDFSFSLRELGLDLRPARLWARIINDIATMPIRMMSAAEESQTILYAYERLLETGADLSESVKRIVANRVNPVDGGRMEINSLIFFPVPTDGYFRIPADIQSVEFTTDTFPDTDKFKAFILTSNVKHIGENMPFSEMVISSEVTKIPPNLICNAKRLTRVRMARSVTSIGENAFSGCENLSKVDFKEGLRKIGAKAFFNTALRSAILPNSLSDIGDEAFSMTHEDSMGLDLSKILFVVSPEVPSCGKRYWNRIGNHRFGYLVRKKYALSIVYPTKSRLTSKGKLRPDVLTEEEKAAFKTLACNYASIMTGGEVTTVDEPLGDRLRSMLGKG